MKKTRVKLFKKILSITLAFLITILIIPHFDFKVNAVNWDGTVDTTWYNTTNTTFSISTPEQLAGLASLVNAGNNFSGKTINLTADIVLNDTSNWQNWGTTPPENFWTAIGGSSGYSNQFSGTFDGNGHTVSGIYINSINDWQGLFGVSTVTIKNVGVINSYIKGKAYIGGVVGENEGGTVTNCYNEGTIFGTYACFGGVAGVNTQNATVKNCYNTGAVTSIIEGNCRVGGVVGYNSGSAMSNCYNTGAVVSSNIRVGGVAGENNGSITNCYNTGAVSGNSDVGGVVGYNRVPITNCYYYGCNVGVGGGPSLTGTTKFQATLDKCSITVGEQATITATSPVWSAPNALGADFAIVFQSNVASISGTTVTGTTVGTSNVTIMIQQRKLTESGFTGEKEAILFGYSIPLTVIAPANAVTPSFNTNLSGETAYTKNDTATAFNGTATVSDGGTVTYKWYKNTTNSTIGGTEILGETNATYTPPTDTVGTSYYYVIATNTNNSATENKTATSISGIKKVIVNNPAVIVSPKTIDVIETPAEIKNPEKISVKPIGEAFNQSVEVRIKDDSDVKKAIKDALDDVIKKELTETTVFPFDISLYVKGTTTKVQPATGTSVLITIPIPENLLANKDNIKVVCIIDGKLTVLKTKVVLIDGVYCAQFNATHFSSYAMVVDTANELSNTTNPKTSGNNTVGTFSIIAILSVVTLAVARKKHKFKIAK